MTKIGDAGLLVLRATAGGFLAAHGAQKVFGVLNGPGFRGTTGFMNMLGLRPARAWAVAVGAGEFGGGVLTALGLFNPIGPIGMVSAMAMATQKAHLGKGFFVSEGGPELTLLNSAAALAVATVGPGAYSLDRAFGLRLPRWLTATMALGATATVVYGMLQSPEAQPAADEAQETAEERGIAIGADA